MRKTTRKQPAQVGDTILHLGSGVVGRVIAAHPDLPAVYRVVRERDGHEAWMGTAGQHSRIAVLESAS